jgi:RNA polymerase sigma factor for flagellar operon FliA
MGVRVSAKHDVAEIWETYRATQRRELRDQLVLHYAALVKYVAGRIAVGLPANVDRADLVSAGIVGLLEAIERFDPDRGSTFEGYALGRIRGAILDELRAADWVPRSVRAKARAIETAYQDLEARLRRAPTDDELADAAGMSLDQLHAALNEIAASGLVALDEVTALGDVLADRGEGPAGLLEQVEARQVLATSVRQLPERERTVLALYDVEGLTLAQIGHVLGVTESRVSQIHAKAVIHLRARLAAADRTANNKA